MQIPETPTTSFQTISRVGSADWVRGRVASLPTDPDMPGAEADAELVEWLYTVVHRRIRLVGAAWHEFDDIAQAAMAPIVATLTRSRDRLLRADNPAAVLERVAARGVAAGRHRVRLAGLGGVHENGRHWRANYPRVIGGDQAQLIFQELPAPVFEPCREIDDAAARVDRWVLTTLAVQLSSDARDAVVYVLDRLVEGVSRAALLRGGHSALANDPAMRHLGFTPAAATALGVWLLGRQDPAHNAPSVLDAALLGEEPAASSLVRWSREAVRYGFGAARLHVA